MLCAARLRLSSTVSSTRASSLYCDLEQVVGLWDATHVMWADTLRIDADGRFTRGNGFAGKGSYLRLIDFCITQL